MTTGYQLCTGEMVFPAEGYEPSLFHLPKHLALGSDSVQSFFIAHPKRQVCCGEVHFHIDGNKAISRLRAPFGSFLFDQRLPAEVINAFVVYCEQELRENKTEEMILVHAPAACYAAQYGLLHPVLFANGFSLLKAEVSALLDISSAGFTASLHDWENRKLRQAKRAGLRAEHLPLPELHSIYDFLAACRQRKGYKLSMNYEEVRHLTTVFPEAIHLFAVFDDKTITAAALCVKVNANVLYAFYYDHHADYDPVSPVVLLIEFVYAWCAARNIRYIDLGTSARNRSINFPLLNFKLRLGARPSPKYTFHKILK